jgi:chromosome segregation ATPase
LQQQEVAQVLEKKVGNIPIVWLAAGGVLLLFLAALMVVSILAFQGIGAARAGVNRLEARLEAADAEAEQLRADLRTVSIEKQQLEATLGTRISSDVGKLEQQLTRQERKIDRLQLQALLLNASGKALKARIHLAEKDVGLVRRDLRECDTILQAAAAFADDETKVALRELRASIVELRDSIEAQTFPLTTLEILIDKIDALVGS